MVPIGDAAAHAGPLLPDLPADRYPAQTLACAFYRAGGVRPVALGPLAVLHSTAKLQDWLLAHA